MSKFDIVEKINFTDLIVAFLHQPSNTVGNILQEKLGLDSSLQTYYFNWGRNALYYLFKNLSYKIIAFPAFTCPTLTEAAEEAGKKVVLIEANINTFNLDISKIPQDTQCLVAVHTFGNPLDISLIKQKIKSIFIIEDCAHALYAQKSNQYVGREGEAVLFSLYKQTPNINGAVLLTKNKITIAQKQEANCDYLKRLLVKTTGMHQWFLDYKRQQYVPSIEPQERNSKQASPLALTLFSGQINRLESEVMKRRAIVKWYDQEFKKSSYFITQQAEVNSQPSYYHFSVRLKPSLAYLRDNLIIALRQKRIFAAVLWPDAPITKTQYQTFQKQCPKALLLSHTIINLPIYSHYSLDDVRLLCNLINKTIHQLI